MPPLPRTENKSGSGVAAVIPAGGSGLRLGGVKKQFRIWRGRPLLYWTLRGFQAHVGIEHIVVVAPNETDYDGERLREELHAYDLDKVTAVVSGGETRQASVYAGICAVPVATGIVLVHDAVRPFVEPALIDEVIDAARVYGAAAPAVPVTDTLRRCADDTFEETIDRAGMYRMQTPQAFLFDVISHAHREAARRGWTATDDVELVMKMGTTVHMVSGTVTNLKITDAADWQLATALLETRLSREQFGERIL